MASLFRELPGRQSVILPIWVDDVDWNHSLHSPPLLQGVMPHARFSVTCKRLESIYLMRFASDEVGCSIVCRGDNAFIPTDAWEIS